jgi:uncharacterized delta-60 repeat protein
MRAILAQILFYHNTVGPLLNDREGREMYKSNLLYAPQVNKYLKFLVPFILILIAGYTTVSVQAHTLVWAKQAGGSDWDEGHGIAVLSDGSAFVTGFFDGTATFGQGDTAETLLTSAGDHDMFVARYNPDGTLAWAKRAGGIYDDIGHGIAVLADGSALVTGEFGVTATFGLGESGETTLTVTASGIFVARYNPDGTLAWAKQAGGGGNAYGLGIAALPDGTALVTGYFSGSATFGPGESGETTFLSAGYSDIFVARYNPDGTLGWAKKADGSGWDYGSSIAVLSDGSALATGWFRDTATFGSGESEETVLICAGDGDIFIVKYNPDGTLAWANRAGGNDGYPGYSDRGYGITVLDDGSFLMTGVFLSTATFGPGESGETTLTSAGHLDVFIARYNPDGTLAWVKQAGGPYNDWGYGIAVLSDGSALVAGRYAIIATFGPGESGETVLTTSPNFADMFIARYNPDGTLAWVRRAGGDEGDWAQGVAALSDGTGFVTGLFFDSATFGPGESGETTLTSAGGFDIFVARFAGGFPTPTRAYWSLYY